MRSKGDCSEKRGGGETLGKWEGHLERKKESKLARGWEKPFEPGRATRKEGVWGGGGELEQ